MSKWEKLLASIRKWNKEKLVVADDNSTKDAGEMTQMMGSLTDSQGLVTGKTGDLTKTASKTSLLLSTVGTTLQTYI